MNMKLQLQRQQNLSSMRILLEKSLRIDNKFPTTQYPTPYQIYHIPRESVAIDPVKLKHIYHKYAHLYHPDLASRELYSSENKLLSQKEKVQRLLMVMAAYDILLSPKKRRLYDISGKGWPYAKEGIVVDSMPPEYWKAGTWEEMQNLKQRAQDLEEEAASEGQKKISNDAYLFGGIALCGIGFVTISWCRDIVISLFE